MKATEFVKKFGIEKARKVIGLAPSTATTVRPSLDFKQFLYGRCENSGGAHILLCDLKRLVESHELVESLVHIYKEIEVVREKASYCGCSECKSRLQAIADVETCQ